MRLFLRPRMLVKSLVGVWFARINFRAAGAMSQANSWDNSKPYFFRQISFRAAIGASMPEQSVPTRGGTEYQLIQQDPQGFRLMVTTKKRKY